MDEENLYYLTNQLMVLQNLYNKKQLEDELKTQTQILNCAKESFTTLEEITSLPNNFCEIVVQKDQPFLEIDRTSGKCLRDIKENIMETFTKNLKDANEIKFREDLEQSVEKLNEEIQERQENNKTLNCMFENCVTIFGNIKGDETINIDDISYIKTDSRGIKACDLFTESLDEATDINQTIKDLN